jgi:hypothetical protein
MSGWLLNNNERKLIYVWRNIIINNTISAYNGGISWPTAIMANNGMK